MGLHLVRHLGGKVFNGKSVLDLGASRMSALKEPPEDLTTFVLSESGCGLLGLVTNFLGANVTMGETPPLIQLINKNIEVNSLPGHPIVAKEFKWFVTCFR
jgi:hypothetical protein